MYDDETAKRGLDALAKFCGISKRTLQRRDVENMKRIGVLIDGWVGRPPSRAYLWFPSVVIRYMAVRQQKRYEREHPEISEARKG